jgi:hypothetical protein
MPTYNNKTKFINSPEITRTKKCINSEEKKAMYKGYKPHHMSA